ncbi:hypothetical protein [Lysinibacillus sp. LZ02]|uniref:hypothetical protein n=1 Tax=Lysinibacillus sp. LZ02 TaxID=3420668 RepID=UPI003D36A2CA
MKKLLLGGTLAMGLLFTSVNQPSAQSIEGISPIDLSSMDLETALMMVQQQRANSLDPQLTNQIQEVHQRNEQITELNSQLSELNQKLKETTDESEKATIQSQITELKSSIDQLNNYYQMDMLRLQSMTNRRNEAFDVMTNFIKKMQDSRSSIIDNMR